jgi:hypothetical protein
MRAATPLVKQTELPAFLVERRAVARKKERKISAPRPIGDVGTAEMKRQQKVTLEVRERSSTGHATMMGARVESQFPIDRYKARKELDPANAWRNLMLWQAAERLREDFQASGLAPKLCGSFEPRVTGGRQTFEADHQVDALRRYKKAMDAVAVTLRSVVFYVCIAGEAANEWARRNGEIPQAGLPILRLGLAELAHHYGYAKIPVTDKTSLAGE